MKRGFTLLELIIVVIIIGILATLGTQQYARVTERSRGAEARQILGQIRTDAAAYRLENNNSCVGFDTTRAGLGTEPDQIPSSCRATHYFSYAVTSAAANGVTLTATRCKAAGKPPQVTSDFTLILTNDFVAGTDVWTGTGGY